MAILSDRFTVTHALAAIFIVASVCVSGCSSGSRRKTEALASRIRSQEETIASLQRAVGELEAERDAARREAATLRASTKNPSTKFFLTEHAEVQARVVGIEISRFLSGGLDRDGQPGEELLTVLVSPVDAGGDTLRATGKLDIEAVDFKASVEKQRLGRWSFSGDEAKDLWHAGLIGRGIQVTVPWKTAPTADTVTVHARLTLPDGRTFDATEELRVMSQSSAETLSQQTLPPEFNPGVVGTPITTGPSEEFQRAK